MSRQYDLDRRHRRWRDLAVAAAAAAGVTLLLAVAVGLVWAWGRSPSQAPVLAVQSRSTPTPRALTFIRNTPTPAVEAPTATTAPPVEEEAVEPTATVVATPEPPAVSAEPETTPEAAAGEEVVFAAPDQDDLAPLAAGSWSASAGALANPGSSAVAEPWLFISAVPAGDFAVEAEIRVTRLLESVCDQSFGLTAGAPAAGQVFGGGLIFPCGSDTPRARLTDVSVWEDGYNADPVLGEEAFDAGDEWHTYRLELRGDQLQLLIDDAGVVSGTLPAPIGADSGDAQAGLWAQGVELEVRKVSVALLPAS